VVCFIRRRSSGFDVSLPDHGPTTRFFRASDRLRPGARPEGLRAEELCHSCEARSLGVEVGRAPAAEREKREVPAPAAMRMTRLRRSAPRASKARHEARVRRRRRTFSCSPFIGSMQRGSRQTRIKSAPSPLTFATSKTCTGSALRNSLQVRAGCRSCRTRSLRKRKEPGDRVGQIAGRGPEGARSCAGDRTSTTRSAAFAPLRGLDRHAGAFLAHRTFCFGCPIAPFHTVVGACLGYGLDAEAFRDD
jgi:hypothetical protein